MLDIESYQDDPYLRGYMNRHQAGEVSPHDRANVAVERADQARVLQSEDSDECNRAKRDADYKRAVAMANLTALLQRSGRDQDAERAASECERIATDIESFDSAKFEDLKRPEPFEVFARQAK